VTDAPKQRAAVGGVALEGAVEALIRIRDVDLPVPRGRLTVDLLQVALKLGDARLIELLRVLALLPALAAAACHQERQGPCQKQNSEHSKGPHSPLLATRLRESAPRTICEGRFAGTPRRSRTPNLLVRSQTLYPVELWAHYLAEREGFEPSVQFPVQLLSRQLPSASRAPLPKPATGLPTSHWRRARDSNPHGQEARRFSRPLPYQLGLALLSTSGV
jgi:hypothetical protein